MSVLIVTGTGTGVGKTVATAALASAARAAGMDVAVCKPVQTGCRDDDDLDELLSVARYPEPLAPVAAAELAGVALPSAGEILAAVGGLNVSRAVHGGRLTLVEGAGGLLVEIAAGGVTLRDLAAELGAPVLVVCEPGLGTLNHTALTLEALDRGGIRCSGLVIGSWPERPGDAETFNRQALARLAPLRAVLPAGAGALTAAEFALMSAQAFDAEWIAGLR